MFHRLSKSRQLKCIKIIYIPVQKYSIKCRFWYCSSIDDSIIIHLYVFFFICTLSIFTKGSSNRTRDGSVGDGLDAGRRNSGRLGQVLGLLPLGHPLQPVSLDVLLHVVPEIWLGLMLKTLPHSLAIYAQCFSRRDWRDCIRPFPLLSESADPK